MASDNTAVVGSDVIWLPDGNMLGAVALQGRTNILQQNCSEFTAVFGTAASIKKIFCHGCYTEKTSSSWCVKKAYQTNHQSDWRTIGFSKINSRENSKDGRKW